jgi:hypothetical protein
MNLPIFEPSDSTTQFIGPKFSGPKVHSWTSGFFALGPLRGRLAVSRPSTYYRDLTKAAYDALGALASGSSSETVGGVEYSTVAALEPVAELYSVKAAIAAVEEGGQGFTHGDGRALSRADLPTLYRRRDQLENRTTQRTRGGIGMKLAVPLG